MTLVEMKYARLKPELSEQSRAADSEHLLLHQTSLAIAAVKVARHQAIDLFVFRNVGVQQI